MTPWQRLTVFNLFLIGVVLGKGLGKNLLLWLFLQNSSGDKWKVYLLVKLHDKVCLAACLKNIKVLIDKYYFCYFKENLGTHLKAQ